MEGFLVQVVERDTINLQLLVKILPVKRDVEILRNGENQITTLNVILIRIVAV